MLTVKNIICCCLDPGLRVVSDNSLFSTSFLSPTLFIPALATLIAAFLGPWFAFMLQAREREKKIKADNITAGNQALFVLMNQFSSLANIRNQCIDPVRSHPLRPIILRPVLSLSKIEDLKFDMSGLSFLLRPRRQKTLQLMLRQTLSELFIEEQRFHTVIQQVKDRSELHRTEVQPLLDQANVRIYADSPDQMYAGAYVYTMPQDADKALIFIETTLGHGLYQSLLQSTDSLIKDLDATQRSLLLMSDKLRNALKQLFPGNTGDILSFEPK